MDFLPEGEPRRTIARDLRLRTEDTYGLILALGRDCAGTVVMQPADEPAPPTTTRTAEPLSQEAIAELVENLRSAPLGTGGRVRISLAGVQEKLLLTRMPDGLWGRPIDGTPSTHILKPEITAYPHTVANEAFCIRVAKHLGLKAAEVETTEFANRKVIVVERYCLQQSPTNFNAYVQRRSRVNDPRLQLRELVHSSGAVSTAPRGPRCLHRGGAAPASSRRRAVSRPSPPHR